MEEAILFLKNISTIEIRHISSSGQECFIGRATIDKRNTNSSTLFTRQVNCEASASNLCSRTWRFSTCLTDKSTAAQIMSEKLDYSIGDELNKEKLVANVELWVVGPELDGVDCKGVVGRESRTRRREGGPTGAEIFFF